MVSSKNWLVRVAKHGGSTTEDLENEPHWAADHEHRIGHRNRTGRRPGITHESEDFHDQVEKYKAERLSVARDVEQGKLVNFRDIVQHQEDLYLKHPENKSRGWRYVLDTTEDWVKKEQKWPANAKSTASAGTSNGVNGHSTETPKNQAQQEHEWKRSEDKDKHNESYATNDSDHSTGNTSNAEPPLSDKYSPQELALLRALEHENKYMVNLREDDGLGESPLNQSKVHLTIDEDDQFSPDNWVPRSPDLIRLTGKHPLNAEPRLDRLFKAGMITPNTLHYVRNHGAVPRILGELHEIDFECDGYSASLSMEDLQALPCINIPVFLACDGNRRKELNLLRKSKGFDWGSGAVGCAYWKGAPIKEVLKAAGIPLEPKNWDMSKRLWLNFEGADDLADGKYSTCIPLDYAMDQSNDVMLAYEMNNAPLPPDHGYPVRVIIPGYVGGRNVKWIKRVWISKEENDSHYHIWDNRVLPAFVTEKDGPFAEALFRHPDTACNEQNLNSIIVKPSHGEVISLSDAKKGKSYRIQGFAYDGGGHQVQRVEVSLDNGATWLYCIRKFPECPIRHGNKFWTWTHWHVDVEISHLVRAGSIMVRCFNVFKNTQPRDANWNVMGMMNNCWYVVRPEITYPEGKESPAILFRHPVEPTSDGGWMKPSTANTIAKVRQEAGAPQKEFTREEVEKHNSQGDCWLVIDCKVYDASSVLAWHPGGAAAILSHAGKVHQETTDEFSSIHDDFAYQKLKECSLGVLSEKAADYLKRSADAAAKERAQEGGDGDDRVVLQKHRWIPVKLEGRKELSKDTRNYTFRLPWDSTDLGLGTCQHVQLGFHLRDKMLVRSYTPTRPLMPKINTTSEVFRKVFGSGGTTENTSAPQDGGGTFDLTIKTYFPDENQPGGAMSNILDCIPIGETVELKGPTGDIVYNGNGDFVIEGKEKAFDKVSLVLGGSGITPGYSLIARILMSKGDKTQIKVVDANKSENDILLRSELGQLEKASSGQLQVTHVLSHPGDDWDGLKGHIDAEKIQASLFPPGKGVVTFMCGPPAMITKAALPALKEWGYTEEDNLFGF